MDMYQIDKKIVHDILERKFRSIIGVYLEQLENLQKKNCISEQDFKAEKSIIQKVTYEAKRDIEQQIDAFSQGVSISVKFYQPKKD